jgi:hypothetical protein
VDSLIKWAIGIALSLAVSGQLKSAALKMAEMSMDAQKHQLSYGKFSSMLTQTPPSHRQHQSKP